MRLFWLVVLAFSSVFADLDLVYYITPAVQSVPFCYLLASGAAA